MKNSIIYNFIIYNSYIEFFVFLYVINRIEEMIEERCGEMRVERERGKVGELGSGYK